ncbi:hypothetical protein FRC01_010597, partial [Tulasnella sp. 417]
MSQSINSPSSPNADLNAFADIDKVSPPSNGASKDLPAEGYMLERPRKPVERCQNDGEEAPDRLVAPMEAPQ